VIFVEIKTEDGWVFSNTESRSNINKIKSINEEMSYKKYWENVFFRSYNTIERHLPEYSKLIRKVKELVAKDERNMKEEIYIAREKMSDVKVEDIIGLDEELRESNDIQMDNVSKDIDVISNPKKIIKKSKRRKLKSSKKKHKSISKVFKEDKEEVIEKEEVSKIEDSWNNIKCDEILDISDFKPIEHKINTKKSIDQIKIRVSRPSGMRNIGNSCYLSSSIQCLKHTKSLWNFITSSKILDSTQDATNKSDIVTSFIELMEKLKEDNQSVAPREFKRVISLHSDQFSGTEQSDAHEFLIFLIDKLRESLKHSSIESIFYGTFKSSIQCMKYKHTSNSQEPFLCISLPIDDDTDSISITLYTLSNHLIKVNIEYDDENTTIKVMKENMQSQLILGPLDIFVLIYNSMLYRVHDYQTIGDITGCKSIWQLYALECSNLSNDLLIKVNITKHIPSFFMRYEGELESDANTLGEHIRRMFVGNISNSIESNKSFVQTLQFTKVSVENVKGDIEYSSLGFKTNIKPSHLRELWAKLPQKEINLKAQKITKSLDLNDCLKKFTGPEKLEGKNQLMCSECKENQDAYKFIEYMILPEAVIIHLKRFKVIEKKARKKISSLVSFPVILFLHTTDGRRHMYSLYAIINHIGDIEGGHYTAYCRNLKNRNEWLEFDDNKVKVIDNSQLITDKAYVLFYEHT